MADKNLSKNAEAMLISIRNCNFEPGIWTKADELFERICKEIGHMINPLQLLLEIAENYPEDEHVLEGVLHILGNVDSNGNSILTFVIAKKCASNNSAVIQDMLIDIAGDLDSSADAIVLLEMLDPKEKWLIEYKEKVLKELRGKNPEEEALESLERYEKAYGNGKELPELDAYTIRCAIKGIKQNIIACPPSTKGSDNLTIKYWCPNCGKYFGQRGKHSVYLFRKEYFCQGCGQKIEWNEEEK